MKAKIIHAFLAMLITGSSALGEEVVIGSRERAAKLFSHPANCHSICFLPQTLEQTIEIYLRKSLDRDGFTSTTVKAIDTGATVKVELTGPGAATYSSLLPKFFSAGDKGFDGASQVHQAGKWRYNWRYFLPLGLPMANHKSVQLLHFPPDYVLEEVQDYLLANTTKRWAELLVINGASPQSTDLYQAIVDIAPISAPASDGKKLEGIYASFEPYIDALLEFWSKNQAGAIRPLVAFGGPVRDYVKDRYGLVIKLVSYTEIPLGNGTILPAVGGNHPSRFYNAINSFLEENPTNKEEAVKLGMRIAQDDLVVACWQVAMAAAPNDGQGKLTTCKSHWSGKDKEICEIVVSQRFKGDTDAAKVCSSANLSTYLTLPESFIEELELRSTVPPVE